MLKLPLCPYCQAIYHYKTVKKTIHEKEVTCHNCGKKLKISYKKGRNILIIAAAVLLIFVNILFLNIFENMTIWACLIFTIVLLLLVIPLFPYTVRYKKAEKNK